MKNEKTQDTVKKVENEPLLDVQGLKKYFLVRKGLIFSRVNWVYAVDGVSFYIENGETLALVGESGCGKSTIGRSVLKLLEPTTGSIWLDGQDITLLSRRQMDPLRRKIQVIFQDPYASLSPRMRAGDIVGEPLNNFRIAKGTERKDRVAELFRQVGLQPEHMRKFPHEFSGGQRQRIGIARALAVNPKLVVCDEPVSALDVSVQAQVINLLIDLQEKYGLSYLFISHDLSVVEHISHRIAVMYLGKIVEIALADELFDNHQHPYTEALLSAVPVPDPSRDRCERIILTGDVPNPSNPPSGCRFRPRCLYTEERCKQEEPVLSERTSGHFIACHFR